MYAITAGVTLCSRLGHLRIRVDTVHVPKVLSERPEELPAAAANIQRPVATARQVVQDPAVEEVIVTPWMSRIERVQTLRGLTEQTANEPRHPSTLAITTHANDGRQAP